MDRNIVFGILIIAFVVICGYNYYRPHFDYDADHIYLWYNRHTKDGIKREYKIF